MKSTKSVIIKRDISAGIGGEFDEATLKALAFFLEGKKICLLVHSENLLDDMIIYYNISSGEGTLLSLYFLYYSSRWSILISLQFRVRF